MVQQGARVIGTVSDQQMPYPATEILSAQLRGRVRGCVAPSGCMAGSAGPAVLRGSLLGEQLPPVNAGRRIGTLRLVPKHRGFPR